MNRRRAFTLIEVLISLAIAGVLLAAVISALIGSIRLRRTAERLETESEPLAWFRSTVRRDFANAVVPSGILAGSFIVTSSGEEESSRDHIWFYTTAGVVTDAAPWGDVRKVEYFLDEESPAEGEEEAYPLIRRETFNLLSTVADETTWRDTVLEAKATGFSIECSDGEEWTESWDSTVVENENPTAVRLTVYTASAEPRVVVQEIVTQPRPVAAVAAAGGGTP
ncbi:prepilin-type N-terminal cleavage/methylation domain-containing protein [bacterium]|nr:prepilin-type N-terminal cleavage/methylation domain-containing protein [bacterium]